VLAARVTGRGRKGAGSHEILLDDATRLAARADAADVAVTLEVMRCSGLIFHFRDAFR
jgi:hypothetical protein